MRHWLIKGSEDKRSKKPSCQCYFLIELGRYIVNFCDS